MGQLGWKGMLSRTVRRRRGYFRPWKEQGHGVKVQKNLGFGRGSCRETGYCSSRNCGLSNLAAWGHFPALSRSSCVLGWWDSLEVCQDPHEENADNRSIYLVRLL